MKKLKYIFLFLILLIFSNDVYANNSYIVLNKQDVDEIEKVLKNNKNITININYNNKDELIAKRKVLDLIKDKNKTITYNIIDNNEIIYKYGFNGNFSKSYNDINLLISFTTDNKIINNTFDNNKKIIINTKYNGYYPNNTIISIKNTINLKNINIYNIKDNKINNLNNNISTNNNFININVFKGDTYILSNKEIVKKETIKTYISILIILIIEIIIFILVILKKEAIEIPKLNKERI